MVFQYTIEHYNFKWRLNAFIWLGLSPDRSHCLGFPSIWTSIKMRKLQKCLSQQYIFLVFFRSHLQVDGVLGLSVHYFGDQCRHINAGIGLAGDEHGIPPEQGELAQELLDGLVVPFGCLNFAFFVNFTIGIPYHRWMCLYSHSMSGNSPPRPVTRWTQSKQDKETIILKFGIWNSSKCFWRFGPTNRCIFVPCIWVPAKSFPVRIDKVGAQLGQETLHRRATGTAIEPEDLW